MEKFVPKKLEMHHELPETGNITVSLSTVWEAATQIETTRNDIKKAIQALRPDQRDWKNGIEKDDWPSVQSLWSLYQMLNEQLERLFDLDIQVPVAIGQIAFNKANPLGYQDLAVELKQLHVTQD